MNRQSVTKKGFPAVRYVTVIAFWILSLWPAEAEAWTIVGKNAVSGGFGFQVGVSRWTPGGFKWFNEYSRELSRRIWLNFQLNTTVGDVDDRHCWTGADGRVHCTGGHWDGGALEIVIGPNLRFPLRKVPLVIDCKLGGAFDFIFFTRDYAGTAFTFRGGVGVHYFITERLGIGAKFAFTQGPAIIDDDVGIELYAAIDFQLIGIEFRW